MTRPENRVRRRILDGLRRHSSGPVQPPAERAARRPDFESYRSLRVTGAALSLTVLVAGGYLVLALALVALLAALVLVVLRWEHRQKDGVMNALYRSISAILVRLGWNEAASRLSPVHGWLLPTPAFVRAARASAKDKSPGRR